MASLLTLPSDSFIDGILAFLEDGGDFSRMSATCSTLLLRISRSEKSWKRACEREFKISSRVVPRDCAAFASAFQDMGLPRFGTKRSCKVLECVPSYQIVWREWNKCRVVMKLSRAAAAAFASSVESWQILRKHLPPRIVKTLGSGISREDFEEFCREFRCSPDAIGALSLFALYSVHDGQLSAFDAVQMGERQEDIQQHVSDVWLGLFGGYSVYDHVVNTRMMSLDFMRKLRKDVVTTPGRRLGPHAHIIAIARDFRMQKFVHVDLRSGLVHIGGGGTTWGAMPLAEDEGGGLPPLQQWFAEFARRVANGMYVQSPILPDSGPSTMGINLFPRTSPFMTTAVTRGIEVTASAIFQAEMGDDQGWAYSIRVRMIGSSGGEGGGGGGGGSRCVTIGDDDEATSAASPSSSTFQLVRRHWEIKSVEMGQTNRVSGYGVIGKFPLLYVGGYRDDFQSMGGGRRGEMPRVVPGRRKDGVFVYQSMTGSIGSFGSFGGELEFVPGSIASPEGPSFRVKVATLKLSTPEYLF